MQFLLLYCTLYYSIIYRNFLYTLYRKNFDTLSFRQVGVLSHSNTFVSLGWNKKLTLEFHVVIGRVTLCKQISVNQFDNMIQIIDTIKKYLVVQRYRYWQWKDKESTSFLKRLHIMSIVDTVDYLIEHQCSCTRYGDGEFLVMSGRHNGFQKEDNLLAERLKEAFEHPLPNLLVCIPTFITDVRPFVLNSQLMGLGFNHTLLKEIVLPNVPTDRFYGDSLFTRFYMNRKDKSNTHNYICKLKKLWNKQELLIVEGKYSRLGVGNELFDNAISIKRILCPKENAFDRYDSILQCVKQNYKGELIILAVGITATVLAYDLAKEDMRVLDLGHIDIEYEWFRMGATHKVPIPNKQMSEVVGGACDSSSDDIVYNSQILADCSV